MKNLKLKCFIGTGGVGKTTLSSLYALQLAKKFPESKVKLVTIDPSNRLKSFFEVDKDKGGQEVLENLVVELNDREALLKDFVSGVAQKKQISIEPIFQNKLFTSLMQGLAVSQEFSSLYELYRSYKSTDYDFVVLDTPPLQNTSDFLKSAEALKSFFSSSLAKFFLSEDERGILYKVINSARRKALNVLSNLTGSDFVEELAFFFKVVENLREDLLEVLDRSKEILEKEVEVVIVGNANELSLCGLKVALENFDETELNLKKCIVNKYDSENVNMHVLKRIEDLKSNFTKLDYKTVSKFSIEPSVYEDLLKVVDDVQF